MRYLCRYTILTLLLSSGLTYPTTPTLIRLASTVSNPYIGPELLNQGYVHQLITEAFAEQNIQVSIEYLTYSKAMDETVKGNFDGISPVFYDKAFSHTIEYSNPFPGNSIGILKRIDAHQKIFDRELPQEDLFEQLKQYRFGITRNFPKLEMLQGLNYELSLSNLQNIDKVAAGRLDFALIDKHATAFLTVTRRPQYIGQLQFVNPPLVRIPFYIAFSKESKHTQYFNTAFNRGLRSLQKKGRVKEILREQGLLRLKTPFNNKINLTIGAVNNPDFLTLQKLSNEYLKNHPNINITWNFLPENTLRLRLLSDLSVSHQQYDIITIGSYEIPIWSEWGWIKPFGKLPESFEVEDILPALRKSMHVRNKIHALPFYSESIVLYVRDDLVQRANASVLAPLTLEHVLDLAKNLHDPEHGMHGICLRGKPGWGENTGIITSMAKAYGGTWFDKFWQPQLTSPQWQKALNMYLSLSQYAPTSFTKNGYIENLNHFKEGRCAMWLDATVAASEVFDPNKTKFAKNIKVYPAPKGDKFSMPWWWTWYFAIPSNSPNADEAKKFLYWATSKQYIEHVANKRARISIPPGTRKSSYNNKQYAAMPFAEVTVEAIQKNSHLSYSNAHDISEGLQWVGIPEFTTLGHTLGIKIAEVYEEKITLEQALEQCQKIVLSQMHLSGYIESKSAEQK